MAADWCWIKEDKFPDFCKPRTKKVVCGKDWSYLDAHDKKLAIAMTHILRLKTVSFTIGIVGVDFLRPRIAPLQNRGRPAWDYKNVADIM